MSRGKHLAIEDEEIEIISYIKYKESTSSYLHSVIESHYSFGTIERNVAVDIPLEPFNRGYLSNRMNLNHLNVVKALSVFKEGDNENFVLERCSGLLSNLLYYFVDDYGRMGGELCADILRQIVDGLHYLHSNHFFHEEMDLENIFYVIKGTELPKLKRGQDNLLKSETITCVEIKLGRICFEDNEKKLSKAIRDNWHSFGDLLRLIHNQLVESKQVADSHEFDNMIQYFDKSMIHTVEGSLDAKQYVFKHPALWTKERAIFFQVFVSRYLDNKKIKDELDWEKEFIVPGQDWDKNEHIQEEVNYSKKVILDKLVSERLDDYIDQLKKNASFEEIEEIERYYDHNYFRELHVMKEKYKNDPAVQLCTSDVSAYLKVLRNGLAHAGKNKTSMTVVEEKFRIAQPQTLMTIYNICTKKRLPFHGLF